LLLAVLDLVCEAASGFVIGGTEEENGQVGAADVANGIEFIFREDTVALGVKSRVRAA